MIKSEIHYNAENIFLTVLLYQNKKKDEIQGFGICGRHCGFDPVSAHG